MKLRIEHYLERGNLDKERIAFKAESDCNLKYFVAHITYLMEEGGFYNKPKETFWFPPTQVKSGDWVVLYSKKGMNSSKVNTNGSTSHFFYWNFSKAIFIRKKYGVVLAEIDTWQTKWVDQ